MQVNMSENKCHTWEPSISGQTHIPYILNPTASRGLSGYRARRRVADSQGPVLVAGLSLNK
jgi:hypothetical protein